MPARQQRALRFSVTPPAGAFGLAIITADVAFDQWDLREWTEALVSVNEPRGR